MLGARKKSGGTTVSHLRFGNKPIKSPYLITDADYIACHNKSFLYNYDLLKGLKNGGNFALNCDWDNNELEENIPSSIKNYIAKNNINFYTIDAVGIAEKIGLGGRINMIMQSAFFKLANVIPVEEAVAYLKKSIEKTYGKKGEKIVEMNKEAVESGVNSLIKVTVPSSWSDAKDKDIQTTEEPDFIKKIERPMSKLEGDDLPVSAFKGMEDELFHLAPVPMKKEA